MTAVQRRGERSRTLVWSGVTLSSWLLTIFLGCHAPERSSPFGVASAGDDDATSAEPLGSATTAGEETTTASEATSGDGSLGGTEGAKFDVPSGGVGCKKVDFLFLVDNSMSMADEQDRLVASFPGFIETIQGTLAGQDYHVMVVATDPSNLGPGAIECSPAPGCCESSCASVLIDGKPPVCNGVPCVDVPAGCDDALGAGNVDGLDGSPCPLVGAGRHLTTDDADLAASFACVARTGVDGHGYERQIDTVNSAVSSMLNDAGGCNEGFLRDDAVLVLTILTDEDDGESDESLQSSGGPQEWFDAVVAAKNGDPADAVVLALVGDSDVADGVCSAGGDVEPAPRLRTFAELFGDRGRWASICNDDFTAFFAEAVALVDTTCDEFEPEG